MARPTQWILVRTKKGIERRMTQRNWELIGSHNNQEGITFVRQVLSSELPVKRQPDPEQKTAAPYVPEEVAQMKTVNPVIVHPTHAQGDKTAAIPGVDPGSGEPAVKEAKSLPGAEQTQTKVSTPEGNIKQITDPFDGKGQNTQTGAGAKNPNAPKGGQKK